MKNVLVLTKDRRLGQKIRLCLFGIAEVTVASSVRSGESFDSVILDTDTVEDAKDATVRLSRTGEAGTVAVPFRLSALPSLIERNEEKKKTLSLSEDGKWAIFGSKRIRLTEVESRLLSLLITAKEPISREEIIDRVWDNEADGGVVNVYIHYLREKLEGEGEKVILSSRKLGYYVDRKFLED